eukprot:2167575-Amphidinium_carterae.1
MALVRMANDLGLSFRSFLGASIILCQVLNHKETCVAGHSLPDHDFVMPSSPIGLKQGRSEELVCPAADIGFFGQVDA